ncbi:MAG TPA: acyl-CoA dehydrogenase family protein [Pantanalinema sp.]
MDFNFTEEQQMLRQMAKEFADREIRPLADKHDKEEHIGRDIIMKMAEQGFLGSNIPEEYGGSSLGDVGNAILAEEIGRVDSSLGVTMGAHGGIGTYGLVIDGTEEQKRKYLPKLASGEMIACFALTEPGAGSDAAAIKTRAVRDGDDWVINGQKMWITNGGTADLMTVFAVTDPALGAHGGVTAFLVERAFGGIENGPKEKKMGIRGSDTREIFFKDVRVPKENVLGQVGLGFVTAMKILDKGRLSLGAACLGSAKEAFDLSMKHATTRIQFGKPIASNQAIQFYLAEMATRIFAMEQMVYYTAWQSEQGNKITLPGSMVKLFCTENATWIINKAVQIHGGMGYSGEYPIERLFRDARICEIFEGTNEIQKVVIAKDILKQYSKEAARV